MHRTTPAALPFPGWRGFESASHLFPSGLRESGYVKEQSHSHGRVFLGTSLASRERDSKDPLTQATNMDRDVGLVKLSFGFRVVWRLQGHKSSSGTKIQGTPGQG